MDKIILVSKQLLQIQKLIDRKDEKKNTIKNIVLVIKIGLEIIIEIIMLETKKKYVRIIEITIKTKN